MPTTWKHAGRADGRDKARERVRCARDACGHPRLFHQVGDGACAAHPGCPCPSFIARSKYGARRVAHDDHWHASHHERERCWVLQQRQAAGEIQRLQLQPRYRLAVNGVKIADYIADFTYLVRGQRVVEDAKGVRTREYLLKRKLMAALYGIEVQEV